MVKDIRKTRIVTRHGYEAEVGPDGSLNSFNYPLRNNKMPTATELRHYTSFILEVADEMDLQSQRPNHAKRNKSGHSFDQDLYGKAICKCGLSAYDWRCTWLWS